MESDDEQSARPYRMPEVTDEERALSEAERQRKRAAQWDEVRIFIACIAYYNFFALVWLVCFGVFSWGLIPLALIVLIVVIWPRPKTP